MIRPIFLPLVLTAILCAAPRQNDKVDLALSASLIPPRYIVDNPGQRGRLRDLLRNLPRDSSQWFKLEGNVLTLSHDLADRLANEEGEERGGEEKGKGRRRARLRLERLAGGNVEEDQLAFPAEYYPNDFALQSYPQWGLRNDGSLFGSVPGVDINMPRVWEQFDGGDSLVVAVLDAGLNFHHPDLQNRWYVNPGESGMTQVGGACWTGTPKDKTTNGCDDDANGYIDDYRGWDFVDGDNDPQDFHSHGTQTSGLIAATFDNGIGIAGMLPRVRILPVRVLSTAGTGSTADIANGIRYAAAMKADAINFSIGVGGTAISTTLRNAFIVARDSGVIVAAASANDGINLDTATTQPASYGFDNVYMIAAHITSGGLAGFSNFGATTVDLAAPGVDIASTTIPPALTLYQENFESFNPSGWSFTGTGVSFSAALDSLEGVKSLKWVSGNNVTATILDTMNMRAKRGGLLRFRLYFQSATANDRVIFDWRPKGSAFWTAFVLAGPSFTGQSVAVNLGALDDTLYQLRFRACVATTSSGTTCTNNTPSNRVLRIDDMRITYADESPGNQAVYIQNTGGTSVAAPYFAGYAALMRLATKRTGTPLTRALMLAGTVAEPALAGKLITGGRLDVSKGLDFYLKTLPRLHAIDSVDTVWNGGDPVAYTLFAADSAGPRNDFEFSAISAPAGSSLTPEGAFTWSSSGNPMGAYILRAKAVKNPLILRTMVRFSLQAVVQIGAAAPGRESVLRIGNRSFLLPAAAFGSERHALRIEFHGADGRTLRTITGELTVPPGARGAEYRLSGFHGVGLRAWLNGVPLRSAPRD